MTRFILAALLLSCAPALAGVEAPEIPAWIASKCSGANDVHRLTPDHVHAVNGGYLVDGYPDLVPYSQAQPSQDEYVWVFYAMYGKTWHSQVYCAFFPPSVD